MNVILMCARDDVSDYRTLAMDVIPKESRKANHAEPIEKDKYTNMKKIIVFLTGEHKH